MSEYGENFAPINSTVQLPSELQETIRRKSSRDPNCRFVRKLHLLLNYVSENPETENQIGIGWVNDEVFRINKKVLIAIMDIKLNTLNVNLRDLKFQQLQSNIDGWTLWKKPGFNRRDVQLDSKPNQMNDDDEIFTLEDPLRKDPGLIDIPQIVNRIKLGCMLQSQEDEFFQICNQQWQHIVDSDSLNVVSSSFFIPRVAKYYKLPNQSIQNSFDVMKAIITPQDTPNVRFIDFAYFLARFGPPETVMVKIDSLLKCATKGRHWLYCGIIPAPEKIGDEVIAAFDDKLFNCLTIFYPRGIQTHAWNMPLVEASQNYILDDNKIQYENWEKFFEAHPIPDQYSQLSLRTYH